MAARGGKRAGAGRKPAIAKGLSDAIAKAVFGVYGSESKAWEALTRDCQLRKDAKMLFEILKYWTDRQYGKPTQPVGGGADGSGPIEHIITVKCIGE